MKHLRKFNESIDQEILNDILLELEDIGMRTDIIRGYVSSIGYIHFIVIKSPDPNNKTIYWGDVEDCILRLKDYLGDNFLNGWYRKYYKSEDSGLFHSKSEQLQIKFDNSLEKKTKILEIEIRYIK